MSAASIQKLDTVGRGQADQVDQDGPGRLPGATCKRLEKICHYYLVYQTSTCPLI